MPSRGEHSERRSSIAQSQLTMNQLRPCNRAHVLAKLAASSSRHSSQSLETAMGARLGSRRGSVPSKTGDRPFRESLTTLTHDSAVITAQHDALAAFADTALFPQPHFPLTTFTAAALVALASQQHLSPQQSGPQQLQASPQLASQPRRSPQPQRLPQQQPAAVPAVVVPAPRVPNTAARANVPTIPIIRRRSMIHLPTSST